jgi:uncharacterized protein (DUF433 family)
MTRCTTSNVSLGIKRLLQATRIKYSIRMAILDHSPITSSPKILGGALVFSGTRVPVQTLLDYLNDGFTLSESLEYFPSVERSDAEEFLLILENRRA